MLQKSMFGRNSQGTEVNNPEGDRRTKMQIINKMVSKFPYLESILNQNKELIERYYDNYKEVKVDT